MKKSLRWTARIVFPLLSILMIVFIFWQSSLDADASSVESESVMGLFNGILEALGITPFIGDYLIRKAAHFSEFFMLGTLLFCTMKVWLEKDILLLIYPAGAGLLVALSDEYIQTFSLERSGELKDAMLDLAGVLAAVVVLYLLLVLYRDIRKNKPADTGSDDEEETDVQSIPDDEPETAVRNVPDDEEETALKTDNTTKKEMKRETEIE